jgi:hypothetical protein
MPLSPRTLRPASSGFNPRQISGLALWLDGADSSSLYTTDAGPVTAVSSPTEISGCALWLDGADSSAASMTLNGSLVETWKDKSNSGNDVTASGGLRPTLTSNALNSRSVLTFGGSQGLTGNLAASIATNAYSVFVVCKITGAITNGRLLSTGGAGNDFASGSVIPCVSNGGTLSAYAGTQGTTTSGVTGFASYGVFAGVLSSNLVTNSAGGMSAASAAATLSTAVTRLGVGVAAQGGTGFNTCDIAEIILYPTALSTADRARVEAYLAAKWGISGVHAQATATSDPVGYWGDKSGNARHATQTTAANRPTLATASINSRGTVAFSGASSQRLGATVPGTDGQLYTVLAVVRNSTPSSGVLVGERGGNFTTALHFQGASSVNRLTFYPAGRTEQLYGPHGAASVIYGISKDTTSLWRGYHNGARVFSDDGSVITGQHLGNLLRNIGSSTAGASAFSGNIAELIAYPYSLTDTERRRVERYLAAKWGITLAPQVSNADAQDWVNRVYANGGTVSASTASAVNTFCDAIDFGVSGVSIRDRFYRLNLFCGGGLNACLVPLYRGQSRSGAQYGNATDSNVGVLFVSGDYSELGPNGGLAGGGARYLNTGLASNVLSAGDRHLSAYETVRSGGTFQTFLGTDEAGSQRFTLEYGGIGSTIQFGYGAFSANITVTSVSTGAHWIGVNSPDTAGQLYRNGTLEASNTQTAQTLSSRNFYVYALNRSDSATSHYGGRLGAYSIGSAMTASQAAAYYNAMQAFQTALSRNV